MSQPSVNAEAEEALAAVLAAAYPNPPFESTQSGSNRQGHLSQLYQHLATLSPEQREEVLGSFRSNSTNSTNSLSSHGPAPTLPRFDPTLGSHPFSHRRNRSTDNYTALPTRSGRIPHLPSPADGLQTRESDLFNNYFDFPSEDDEDPDFFPQLDGVNSIAEWDELLIPGEYGSSEMDESGAESYRNFLIGLSAENNPLPVTSLPSPSPIASTSQLPEILPPPVVVTRPPTKKRGRKPSLSPLPEDPSSAVFTSPAADILPPPVVVAPVVPHVPKKRIKLTPEESKARRAARSAAAAEVRKAEKLKNKPPKVDWKIKAEGLEVEVGTLKQRIRELELILGNAAAANGGKMVVDVRGILDSGKGSERSGSELGMPEPEEDSMTENEAGPALAGAGAGMNPLMGLQGMNAEQLLNLSKLYQFIAAQTGGGGV